MENLTQTEINENQKYKDSLFESRIEVKQEDINPNGLNTIQGTYYTKAPQLELYSCFLKDRPFRVIICEYSLWFYCEALDNQEKPFSTILDRGTYEFDTEEECIDFLKENIDLIY
jgi:hypothetical protein